MSEYFFFIKQLADFFYVFQRKPWDGGHSFRLSVGAAQTHGFKFEILNTLAKKEKMGPVGGHCRYKYPT